jgi:phosphohistidine phosphatase SixA
MTIATCLGAVALTAVLSVDLAAQSAVFIVRHAERADTASGAAPAMNADPELSDAGRARAVSLAAILKDAGITAIYVTQYKRTQQTAAPIAQALGLTPVVVDARDVPGLVAAIGNVNGHALVVGHSNSVIEIARALGVDTPLAVQDDEYDNLFVVARGPAPHLLRLRYR